MSAPRLVLPFTRELSLWEPARFVDEVLVATLHAAEVHVGVNFRYGHRAAGTVDSLRADGERARLRGARAAPGRRGGQVVVDLRAAVPRGG